MLQVSATAFKTESAFQTDPKTKDTAVASNQVCTLEKLVGIGTDPSKFSTRWYFDSVESLMCVSFLYRGTGGNKNNFKTKAECLRKCSHAGINLKILYHITLLMESISVDFRQWVQIHSN